MLCFSFQFRQVRSIDRKDQKKTLSILRLGKDEERSTLRSWYHLHASMPRGINLVEYKHTPARSRGHPADFASSDFFSQLRVFLHDRLTCKLFTSRSLSVCNQPSLLVPSQLLRYAIVRFSEPVRMKRPIKKPFILRKDEERSIHSRGTTFMRRYLAASTSSSTSILQSDDGDYRQRRTFASSDFFSQLGDFFHSAPAYGFSTSHPFSACGERLLLGPSRLLDYSVVASSGSVYHVS